MPAVKSDNRLHAEINLNYIIRVYEYRDTITVTEDGKTKKENRYWPKNSICKNTF
ncbi:hypothetical protein ACLI09_08605 [Flavobacterium sp. RHBU_24]|uniref:hypothetical protein n=1 Tax=Flavobacterium sp. RHBU_24 TaxID=3391185 RepID=UPI0039854446